VIYQAKGQDDAGTMKSLDVQREHAVERRSIPCPLIEIIGGALKRGEGYSTLIGIVQVIPLVVGEQDSEILILAGVGV
jgi:hypothetical protein